MINKKSFLVVSLLFGAAANATPVVVTFSGQWWSQTNSGVGGTQEVPFNVPNDLQIRMTVDPDINTFDTVAINQAYMTRFPSVTVESAIIGYGTENPYGLSYAKGSFATVYRSSAPYAPFKIESQNIGYRELSGKSFADGGSGQWEKKLWISSSNLPVSLIRPINSADLMSSFSNAITEQRQYVIAYENSVIVYNTSMATGYPYTGYVSALTLSGYAQITSISAVPEPATACLFLAGIVLLGGYKKIRRGKLIGDHSLTSTT